MNILSSIIHRLMHQGPVFLKVVKFNTLVKLYLLIKVLPYAVVKLCRQKQF